LLQISNYKLLKSFQEHSNHF